MSVFQKNGQPNLILTAYIFFSLVRPSWTRDIVNDVYNNNKNKNNTNNKFKLELALRAKSQNGIV